jgi:hypothetical protein
MNTLIFAMWGYNVGLSELMLIFLFAFVLFLIVRNIVLPGEIEQTPEK